MVRQSMSTQPVIPITTHLAVHVRQIHSWLKPLFSGLCLSILQCKAPTLLKVLSALKLGAGGSQGPSRLPPNWQ